MMVDNYLSSYYVCMHNIIPIPTFLIIKNTEKPYEHTFNLPLLMSHKHRYIIPPEKKYIETNDSLKKLGAKVKDKRPIYN